MKESESKNIIAPMRSVPASILILLALPAAVAAQAVIPQPVRMTAKTGVFTITARTVIWTDRGSTPVGHQLARYLEPATGFTLRVMTGGQFPSARSCCGATRH